MPRGMIMTATSMSDGEDGARFGNLHENNHVPRRTVIEAVSNEDEEDPGLGSKMIVKKWGGVHENHDFAVSSAKILI